MRLIVAMLASAVVLSTAKAADSARIKSKADIVYALPSGLPELRQSELVKAVGLPVAKKYQLEDGRGFNFRSEGLPYFKIEFRANRVNVAWVEFFDDPKRFEKINEENKRLAEKTLSIALGADLGKKVVEYAQHRQPAVVRAGRVTVYVSEGGFQNLVTIVAK